ncbi:hypothetical protein BAUCODRAFT_362128 [Baudoinia panamericana UAMH 10762]|uniref:Uncharacterized protein n=1 Tax=Baudoinia panamericana (strain UAMH 10762) TaxID=717646 RepID=M2LZE2_BAUPA|nr:uncharacterized protein BAUCODRAFT_362128 [Baudoinia panamericana UAMH 10762]EMD00043.1 hypothetical protein BAUCODRAFT_362128 [Baudoinia panamericana UAMH 10762]
MPYISGAPDSRDVSASVMLRHPLEPISDVPLQGYRDADDLGLRGSTGSSGDSPRSK